MNFATASRTGRAKSSTAPRVAEAARMSSAHDQADLLAFRYAGEMRQLTQVWPPL